MQTNNPSICIVASTLPVGLIASQAEALRIQRIYVLSKEHEQSYQLLSKLHPAIEIVKLPAGLLMQSIRFLFILTRARLAGIDVIFFHECCMPLLDLLICAIRPRGTYYPQVTMSGWHEIDSTLFPRSKVYLLLKSLRLVKRFKFYKSNQIGDYAHEYAISIRQYPDSIAQMDARYSRELVALHHSSTASSVNKILFVIGKSSVSDASQSAVFSRLITLLHAMGFMCHIKDHPNPIYRLNLHINEAVVIDPLIPVELMDKDYRLAVGLTSSALLSFNERAVSIIHMFEEMSLESRLLNVKHFEEAFPGNRLNFIRSIDEFKKLL